MRQPANWFIAISQARARSDRDGSRLQPVTASTPPATSIFNIGDVVTIPEGEGVVEHVHQTTGELDVMLAETDEVVETVRPSDVTTLNGLLSLTEKSQTKRTRPHCRRTSRRCRHWQEVAFRRWRVSPDQDTDAGGRSNRTLWKRLQARARSAPFPQRGREEGAQGRSRCVRTRRRSKQPRQSANCQGKREAAWAKREAARLRKEDEKRARKAEAARKKLAKSEAAKAKRAAKLSARAGRKKTTGTSSQLHRTFQWNLIKGSDRPKALRREQQQGRDTVPLCNRA